VSETLLGSKERGWGEKFFPVMQDEAEMG